MTDEDLRAVREMVQPRIGGAPVPWATIEARLGSADTAGRAERERRGVSPPWWRLALAVPAVAVAVIVVLLTTSVVRMYADRGDGGSTVDSATRPTPSPNASVEARGSVVPGGPYADTGRLDPYQLLATLANVAAAAGPPEPGPGPILFTHMVGWIGGAPTPGPRTNSTYVDTPYGHVEYQESVTWADTQGMILLAGTAGDGSDLASAPKADLPGTIAAARSRFAAEGPSLSLPTPAFLAGLPTDPAVLTELVAPSQSPGSKWSRDHDVFAALQELLTSADPFLSGGTRVGLLRAIAARPNLSAATIDADGTALVAVRYTEPNPTGGQPDTQEILFDPATGHVVGGGSVVGDPANPTRFQYLRTQHLVQAVGNRS
jgi:hypothetical protein